MVDKCVHSTRKISTHALKFRALCLIFQFNETGPALLVPLWSPIPLQRIHPEDFLWNVQTNTMQADYWKQIKQRNIFKKSLGTKYSKVKKNEEVLLLDTRFQKGDLADWLRTQIPGI